MMLREMVESQIIEEVGADRWLEEEIPEQEMLMLAQKWGLRIPILTQPEVYLMHREETKCRKNR